MANWESAKARILQIEGGYQRHENDRGNWICPDGGWVKGDSSGYYCDVGEPILVGTKYGIAAPTLSAYLGRSATEEDMRNLSVEVAADILKKQYWDRPHLSEFRSQVLAEIVFDASVNHGRRRSIKWLQEVANNLGADLTIDGGIGILTLAAIEKLPTWQLHNAYKKRRLDAYDATVAADPGQSEFIVGWRNRVVANFPDLPEPMEDVLAEDSSGNSTSASLVNSGLDPKLISASVRMGWNSLADGMNDFLVSYTPFENRPNRDSRLWGEVAIIGLAVSIGVAGFLVWRKNRE